MSELQRHLKAAMEGGRKLLVPYLMAGIPDDRGFVSIHDRIAPYSDAVEIGVPFSDPLMDGPVIAAAGARAIRAGVGPGRAVELASSLGDIRPRVAMTYYNPIHMMGERAFCMSLVHAGISGLIVPDLPWEESESLRGHAAETGLGWIPLVAPTSTRARAARVAASASGFVYAVSALGVTGARTSLSERAAPVVELCRAETDLPVLIGIGISSAEHAVEAASLADGVIVGSALMQLVMEASPEDACSFVAQLRDALDSV